MGSAIGMDDWPLFAVVHGPDGCIQHGIDEARIWLVPMDQLITLPSGIWNSVMSVSYFTLGALIVSHGVV
jgi:hypothetical protein